MEQYCSVRNASCAATAGAASPLVHLEVLVTVSCTLLTTLVFFGSGRRRTSSGAAFRFLVSLAVMLCYPAVFYTIWLIESGSSRNGLVVVWGCFLLSCACSVDDSAQQACTLLNQATQVIYVTFLLLPYISFLELHLQILVLLLWVLNLAKLAMRLWILVSAGRDRVPAAANWLISEYMAHEYVRSIWDFDPDTMKGYKYVVTGEKDVQDGCAGYRLEVTDDLVTVDRVWQYEGSGSLLSKNNIFSSKLKDLCLSFALFKLLRRRLSKNPLPERDDIRTLVFVRRGLAGGDSSNDYERMFRVIEVELGFLFDFFYSRYPSLKQSLFPKTAIFVAAVALSLSTLFSPALLRYHDPQAGTSSFVSTGLDIWFARFVIVLFLILELFQYLSALWLLYLSDWHKVKMLCLYVRKPSWILERLLGLMCRTKLTTRYWNNSLGQYSLLHACLQKERYWLVRMPMPRWIKGLLIQTRTVSQRSLPVTVKQAIHQLLRSEWLSNLKYGDRTLQRNNMLQDFDWSTSRYQHGAVGSILVWHIATAICSAKLAGGSGRSTDGRTTADSREVATALSNYCAYLLFQAPELVTDQIYGVRRLMEALQLRIQQFLQHTSCRSEDEMFDKLSGFEPSNREGWYEETILADGIKLGDQLIHQTPDEAVRWNILSEMWVELLLSVVPSDNVTAHVKKLATGGEFITHLWALLTHAGIIDKPNKPYYESTDTETDTPNDAGEEYEGEETAGEDQGQTEATDTPNAAGEEYEGEETVGEDQGQTEATAMKDASKVG